MNSCRTFPASPLDHRSRAPDPQPRAALCATFLAFFWLGACQSQPSLETVARDGDLRLSRVSHNGLPMVLLAGSTDRAEGAGRAEGKGALHIYLGGDGRPWAGERPAADPSGRRLLALELMARDPAPALYLGRPCYHPDAPMPPACGPELWTGARYSETVVDAMAGALREALRERRPESVLLVGYSGGGALAVLLAPRLADLAPVAVLTLAANLDTGAWTDHQRVLPLTASLNPALQRPSGVPEVHWLGEEDTVVPPETVQRYSHRHPGARFLYVAGFGHRCCWVAHWPEILARTRGELDRRALDWKAREQTGENEAGGVNPANH